ncbi:hypothetical protein [Paenibacillus silviterrae]|uniref:hypothetical protein n=1 Tax=Paenibacillus silviterrae TaxID=3242194 RepID=UPI0025431A32|nr:hypothetical protein [Paenibacillus chinjuensis]
MILRTEERVTRPMTSDTWKEVEKKLLSLYNQVKLLCDGYELTIMLERSGQFKNHISIYINEQIKGAWMIEDCEERRRFFCERQKSFYTKKQKESVGRVSKKLAKELGFDKKYSYYTPYWNSFRSLKSHLIKNNQNIELIEGHHE